MKNILIFLLISFVFSTLLFSQNRIVKGRILGVDPDGKIKIITLNSGTKVINFDYEKMEFYFKNKDKNIKSTVFDVSIGNEAKIYVKNKEAVRMVFWKTKETLRDFLFKNQKVKMLKAKFKQLDSGHMKIYFYDKPAMYVTPYTKYLPHYGEYVSKDTVIVGYIDGPEKNEKIVKWVRLKKRK